eukprot:1897826-Amphidinium_carterae.2
MANTRVTVRTNELEKALECTTHQLFKTMAEGAAPGICDAILEGQMVNDGSMMDKLTIINAWSAEPINRIGTTLSIADYSAMQDRGYHLVYDCQEE